VIGLREEPVGDTQGVEMEKYCGAVMKLGSWLGRERVLMVLSKA